MRELAQEEAPPRVLSLVELTAVQATQMEITRLQRKLRAILEECGLEPEAISSVEPDGTVRFVGEVRDAG